MLIQISSGQGGPQECEYACCLFYYELLKEFPALNVVATNFRNKNCLKSAVFYSEIDISFLKGTILWCAFSSFRPNHRRKNWFVDVSVLQEKIRFDNLSGIRFETFRASGAGGQHVNKSNSAVRAIHITTAIFSVSSEQRSQIQNKKVAYFRLLKKLENVNKSINQNIDYNNWNTHRQLVRGKPIRIYKGINFKRVL